MIIHRGSFLIQISRSAFHSVRFEEPLNSSLVFEMIMYKIENKNKKEQQDKNY